MNILPCKAKPDILTKQSEELLEYIAVYVDYPAFIVRDQNDIIATLEEQYKHKLKYTGSISYHLVCDLFRDNDGVLCMVPKGFSTTKSITE